MSRFLLIADQDAALTDITNLEAGTERSNQMSLQTTFTMYFRAISFSLLQISSSTRVWDDFS